MISYLPSPVRTIKYRWLWNFCNNIVSSLSNKTLCTLADERNIVVRISGNPVWRLAVSFRYWNVHSYDEALKALRYIYVITWFANVHVWHRDAFLMLMA